MTDTHRKRLILNTSFTIDGCAFKKKGKSSLFLSLSLLLLLFLLLLHLSVIYDSCPQAIEAGIWWPRTKFGLPAAVPCPKGTLGMIALFSQLIKPPHNDARM